MKTKKTNVFTVGITGTIGVGKSLTGKILEELGIPVIDTDKIVHELLAKDPKVISQIKKHFAGAFNTNQRGGEEIDRKYLAKIIFENKEAKTKLEEILHPKVREVCKQKLIELESKAKGPIVVATLVPLLFEAKRQSDYDQIWAIFCEENILHERIARRDGLSHEEINLRLSNQLSQKDKIKQAHKVLDNSADENHLREQILENLRDLKLPLPGLNSNLKK